MIQAAASAIYANSIENQSDTGGVASKVTQAIKNAAAKTGVDFSYLMQKATQESSLNPTAKASTSSATGLFQFTGQTWLRMIKNVGTQYGLGDAASKISIDSSGTAHVADKGAKQAILALRNDPTVSAEMAGELDKQNMTSLKSSVGGKIGGTELYLAHFLGASGASDFISEMRSNPNATAASVLPDAAAANTSVFYSSDGTPRTLKQIYQHFAQKFDSTASSGTLVASADTTGINTAKSAAISTVGTNFSAYATNHLVSGAARQTTGVTVADASTGSSTVAGVTTGATATALSSINAMKSNTSSLFATMILAQMHQSEKENDALAGTSNSNEHKSAISLINALT